MITRSKKKKVPEIIEIDSDNDSIKQFKSDDSSCSSSSSFENTSSVELDSLQFMNLAPTCDQKKKKNMSELKNYLHDTDINKSSTTFSPVKQFERAPILNLLKISHSNEKKVNSGTNNKEPIEPHSHSPPCLPDDSNEEVQQIIAISLPRKKPKLMAELQQYLNRPTIEYKTNEMEKQLRSIIEQRKRENKRKAYLMQKRQKEIKIGKKQDAISNQVYNSIQDFFA